MTSKSELNTRMGFRPRPKTYLGVNGPHLFLLGPAWLELDHREIADSSLPSHQSGIIKQIKKTTLNYL